MPKAKDRIVYEASLLLSPAVLAISAGIAAILIALRAAFFELHLSGWIVNIYLLVALIGMMLVEAFTGWRSQRGIYRPRGTAAEPGWDLFAFTLSKLTLMSLLVLAGLLDWVLVSMSPIGFVTTEMIAANWVTRGALLWLITGQVFLILDDVQETEGAAAIPPVFRYVVRVIRGHDNKRFPHDDNAPRARWYDALEDLTDDELDGLIKRREERMRREAEEGAGG